MANPMESLHHGRIVEDLGLDLRFAFRTLRSTPAFTIAVLLTLGIGIGVNTAIFSAVDGVLLKPLPFADADRIITLGQRNTRTGQELGVSSGNFLAWRERVTSFSAMAFAEPFSVTLDAPDGPEMVRNWNVTEGFFDILGVRAVIGRAFTPSDHLAGSARVVVISTDSWHRRFGSDPRIIGRRLIIEKEPATIVGVMPPNAGYPFGREMWTPKIIYEEERREHGNGPHQVIARLKPSVTLEQATAEMRAAAARLAREFPTENGSVGVSMVPIADHILGATRPGLLLLLGAVGLVLLIACGNVANLMLARMARRARELAIRTALGAGPARLVRQLMVESLTLGLASSIAGVGLAHASMGTIRASSPAGLPRVDEMQVDVRAVVFALALGAVSTVFFGLTPALRAARLNVREGLGGSERGATGGMRNRTVRDALVVAEVALAVVLLVAAGLLVRSFTTLVRVDRGYRSDHVLAAPVFIWQWNPTPERRAAFVARAIERLRALPGVRAVGATSSPPVGERIGPEQGTFVIAGDPAPNRDERPTAHVAVITPGALEALGVPQRAGRAFGNGDDASAPPVALVNEEMARRYWPDESPIGKRLTLSFTSAPIERTVVGVVGNVRHGGLENAPRPSIFIPHAQAPTGSLTLLVRTTGEPAAQLSSVRAALASLDRDIPIARASSLDALIDDALGPRRFSLVLLATFSLTALALAIIGVYGVVSHRTAERRREFGVRIALGAQGTDILRMVVSDGARSALLGVVAGVATAAALTRLLRAMLFAVTPLDWVTFAAVSLLMITTVLVACYVPALRATKVDPLTALRSG